MTASELSHLQDVHVAAWNEKDQGKREELLQQIYSPDIIMYDKDAVFNGLQEVSDFIGKLLNGDQAFAFSAVRPIESLQDSARLFGEIRTSGGPLQSMDFMLIENGLVARLYAFIG